LFVVAVAQDSVLSDWPELIEASEVCTTHLGL